MRITLWACLFCVLAGGVANAKPGSLQPGPKPVVNSPLKVCPAVMRGSIYGSAEDVTLFPGYPTSNGGDMEQLNVAGFVGSSGPGSNAKILLKFSIKASAIPVGASITYAEVVMTQIDPPRTSGTMVVTVGDKTWSESTVTPNSYKATAAGPSYAFSRSVPLRGATVRFDVTQPVIAWMSGAVANNGFVIAAGPSQPLTDELSAAFYSSDATSHKPYLKICYEVSACSGKADGTACTDEHTCTTGTCQSGVCKGQSAPAGTVCRKAFDKCDKQEVCDGTNMKCPTADISPAWTACRAVAGICDVAESCDGAAAECPTDAFKPNTTECRASAGTCDVAEKCTGTGAQCPADGFKSASTVCRPAAGSCDNAESCTGTSAQCPEDKLKAAGVVCRQVAGDCDVAESCVGSSAQCPNDGFKPSSTVCRPAAGPCDVAENCSGGAAACPSNKLAPNNQSCGNAMVCANGQCIKCGIANAPCCPTGAQCGNNASLICQSGTCRTCGGAGGPCCTSGTPCSGSAFCVNQMCVQCAGAYQACCNFTTCLAGNYCSNSGSAFAKCEPCGNLGQPCCNGTYGCNSSAPVCTEKYSGGKYTCQKMQ